MSDFQLLLDMLAEAGVTQRMNEIARRHGLTAIARPQDAAHLSTLLPDVEVRLSEAHLQPDRRETTIIDCRPSAPRTEADVPPGGQTPTLLDAVACFLTQATSLQPASRIGRRYYLLSTPRSGSTFLCDLLTRTGVLGRPTEHLKPWLRRYMAAANIPLPVLIERLHAHSATSNGVFGSKIIINDLFEFLADHPDELCAELSHHPIFLIVRSDKAAQALSNTRSNQLAIYHADNGNEAEIRRKLSTFRADYKEVFDMERWLLRQEADLLDLLRKKGLRPHLLSYEACVQSRQGANAIIQEVAASLQVEEPRSLSWPELIKVANLSSDDHLARYRAKRRGIHLFSTRSEPWLGLILGSGWKNPEGWGVRSESLELTLRIPARVHPSAIEILTVLESHSCPQELTIGSTRLQLTCPATGSRSRRDLIQLDEMQPTTISIRLSNGEIGLEEVVLYEQGPDWHLDS